jgi:hypothetical protein
MNNADELHQIRSIDARNSAQDLRLFEAISGNRKHRQHTFERPFSSYARNQVGRQIESPASPRKTIPGP